MQRLEERDRKAQFGTNDILNLSIEGEGAITYQTDPMCQVRKNRAAPPP
jgi:hypothetical protein